MEATFYSFNKRRNSTARPSGGTTLTINIKEASSAINPTIEAQLINGFNYNYCYIPTYGRYYWITDIVYSRTVWTIKASVDVLATYKSAILNTRTLVRYSTNGANQSILDPRMAQLETVKYGQSFATIEAFDQFNKGCYVVSCIGNTEQAAASAGGMANLYVLYPDSEMLSFVQLFNAYDWASATEKIFTNPMECLISCNWLPFGGTIPSTQEPVYIGKYQLGMVAGRVSTRTYQHSYTLTIPWATDNDYRRSEKYVSMSLYLPYVGVVPLNAGLFKGYNSFDVDMCVDYYTGAIAYRITVDDNVNVLATFSGSCASSVPIANTQQNLEGIAAGAITSIGGIMSGNPFQAVGGGMSAISSLAWHSQINGGLSSRVAVAWGRNIILITTTKKSAEEPDSSSRLAAIGGPTDITMALATLGSGYVETYDAHVAISGTEQESSEINNLLNSGIYLE